MENKIIEAVAKRWSPIAFSDQPVADEVMQVLFEAARWAPSAYNEQPWRFIYAAKKDRVPYEKMLATLVPGNREWAQYAPVLVLVLARKLFSHNEKTNSTALYDTGMAVGNLLAQATSMGLVIHQMGGFDHTRACEDLEIPGKYMPVAMMAIGYYGRQDRLSDTLREREKRARTRKPLDELLHYGSFQGA